MPIKPEVVHKKLEALKETLEQASGLSDEARQTVELDQQAVGRLSRMDALQAQAMAQAQERKRQADIIRIDMALRRLAEGEYGYCSECGEEIPAARLEIDPMAERCVSCA
ncbi:MAG: TraR/DksA family transcriptional regulator [Pseudomonadota bacterium]